MRHGRVILRPQPRWVGDDRTIAARSLDRGDILDGDFSNDGSPITPLIIDDTTPSSSVPAVYLHGVVTV